MEAKGPRAKWGLQDQTSPGLWALDRCVSKEKVIHSGSGLAATCYVFHHQAHHCGDNDSHADVYLSVRVARAFGVACFATMKGGLASSRSECGLLGKGCAKKTE